jgi:hypothetical protein
MRSQAGHVVIEGQCFVESDETRYLIASDILQGVSDDLEGLALNGADAGSSDGRVGPIAEIMQLLESRMGHEESLTWIVSPHAALGGRPLDLVTSGRAGDVLDHIRSMR